MCGICFVHHTDKRSAEATQIQRMVRSLAHRGPDAQTQLIRGATALGHTRLSIVDREGGAQPMLSKDERYAIVFNGEIYNYRQLRQELQHAGVHFRTQSDTEVLLELYIQFGTDCLARLRGMFAFAIHDRDTQRLFLSRDRLGIKPLFYSWDGNTLAGASEIKALFAGGLVVPRLDPAAIRSYFTYQFAPSSRTPFHDVVELPPGHYMLVEAGKEPQTRQWWNIHFPRDGEYESLEEDYWLQRFGDTLDDAAACHAMGDVPIGSYLSGGIDSSATTHLLTQHHVDPVQTFTIRFTNSLNDESPIAASIAAQLGVLNRQITMDDDRPEGFLPILRDCVYHLEQPQRMALDVPLFELSGLVNQHGCKVVYSGEGADEIFGGYDCYRQNALREKMNGSNFFTRRRLYLKEYSKDFAEEHARLLMKLHEPKRQRETLRRFGCYPAWHDFWHILHVASEPLFDTALRNADTDLLHNEIANIRPHLEGLHPLNQSLYLETKTRLPGWILWKGDRLSMAHGVEARLPFLDHHVVELTARIPPGLKLNGMDEKYLLHKLVTPHLPPHPTHYKKRAFYTPIREWFFTAEKQEELAPYLSDHALEECGFFRPVAVRNYLQRINDYGQPQDLNQYFSVMKMEWSLLLVLTVQMLHALYVKGEAPCFH